MTPMSEEFEAFLLLLTYTKKAYYYFFLSEVQDASKASKRRGPYKSYLADSAAKIPKVSDGRKRILCDLSSTTVCSVSEER